MKKLLAISVLGVVLFSGVLSLSGAAVDEASATGMSGSPEEYSDLEKTLKMDRIDTLESRVSDLSQANKFLSQRVTMLERSVNDLKDKVDRSFR